MWWRSGGSSTLSGKNCSSLARSALTGFWLSVTVTQRDPQCAQPQGAEAVDVPDDQAPLALKQFAEGPHHPVVISGFGGVQHMQSAGRVAVPVHSPQQRQL